MLQLMRLEPALRLAAEAVVSGDIKAVRYYLKLLDQLDRCEPAVAAPQVHDEAARETLSAKPGRTATRLQARKVKQPPVAPRPRAGAGDPILGGRSRLRIRAARSQSKNLQTRKPAR